ncbi:putative reverse transcriptase domain-containing protein [Tanacetum coccineum]
MENVPPPNNDLNVPKEEPIPEQALAAPVGFGLQWIGGQIPNNNNGWLKEDDEEDPKEDDDEDPEEDEVDEDNEEDPEKYDDEDLNEDEVGNGEEEEKEIVDEIDNPEVIDPDVPPPPVFQSGHKFHVGESSSTRGLLDGNYVVFAHCPKPSDLMTIHGRMTKLEKQMFERYKTEIKIKKKFNKDNLHMNRHKLDVTIKYSKMKRPSLPEGLRFQEEPPIPSASVPRSDDLYVMARDVAMAAQEDDDDDAAAAENPQPLESRGSPRDQVREEANRAGGPAGGPAAALVARECTFAGFMKCGPTQFHGTEGAVATLGREVANGRPWTEVKQMMIDEFCPIEEVQRLEDEPRHLKLRDMNIAAYTERFNKLALLCPDVVPNEKKKVELYIKGLPDIIKGETTSSRPATLNEAVRMAHALMEQKIQAKNERIAEGLKRKWENNNQGGNNHRNNNDNRNKNNNRNNNNRNNRGNYRDNNRHNQYNQRRQDEHNSSDLAPQRQEMFVKNVSSGLVPQGQKTSDYDNSDPVPPRRNVVPPVEKTDSSQQGLEFLFSPLL